MEIVNLSIFMTWVSVVMYLAADPRVPAYNREFAGLIIATACLFYGLITADLWIVVLVGYMGLRTYQKAKTNGKEAHE